MQVVFKILFKHADSLREMKINFLYDLPLRGSSRFIDSLHYSSLLYSSISPASQLSASHIAASVEKRIAVTLLFFIFERLTFEIPTLSASSFNDIFLSTIILSRRKTIFPILSPIKVRQRLPAIPVRNETPVTGTE